MRKKSPYNKKSFSLLCRIIIFKLNFYEYELNFIYYRYLSFIHLYPDSQIFVGYKKTEEDFIKFPTSSKPILQTPHKKFRFPSPRVLRLPLVFQRFENLGVDKG